MQLKNLSEQNMYRIGQGFDLHRLVEGRALILGGIRIKHDKGLLGHSDADVLVHAIIDSLLGALCLGDIGQHFPDTDLRYKNANSMELLKTVLALVEKEGYKIVNIDSTIQAQEPKLMPHITAIRENLSKHLSIGLKQVSVKAKTYEKQDSIGRGEAIAVYCNTLLMKANV